MKTLAALVFPEFQTLDLFGPLEMFGDQKDDLEIVIVAETADPVISRHGQRLVPDRILSDGSDYNYIFVPGGPGTPVEEDNPAITAWLIEAAAKADLFMGVCTAGALLARAGVLDGRRATTNKQDFEWSLPFGPKVDWIPKARWVEDGKFFTSSGVSAGIDMSLAVIAKEFGLEAAEKTAREAEYDWHRDSSWDPFAQVYGLA
jgi:transcriptional regulator GlxA family with amidase domain